MKKLIGIIGSVLGAALIFGMLSAPMNVKAATSYKVTWDGGDWFTSDDGGKTWYSKDFIESHFAEGDVVVIDGQSSSSGILMLNLPARVGELAVIGGAVANVTAPGAGTVYATTGGNTLIFNGDVDTLNANYGAVNQINGNVKNVNVAYKEGSVVGVGITGTVGSANVLIAPDKWNQVMASNFAAGTFSIGDDNFLKTDPANYTLVGSAPAANSNSSSSGSSNSGAALDKVPKTGRSYNGVFIISAALLLIAGGSALYVKSRKTK